MYVYIYIVKKDEHKKIINILTTNCSRDPVTTLVLFHKFYMLL